MSSPTDKEKLTAKSDEHDVVRPYHVSFRLLEEHCEITNLSMYCTIKIVFQSYYCSNYTSPSGQNSLLLSNYGLIYY